MTPDDFGRIAAQTAKQVILQRIREAERDMTYDEYQDRVGELITGIVQQSDSRYTLVQLRERVEALLPRSEQVHGERYEHGARVKAIISDVSNQAKGPSIVVSRRSPELISKLFELEVPEIADGLVEIQNVAREPGYRSKIAVVSHASGVDPVGACVGPRGSRVRMVVSELRGEKIDIIPFNDEPARFVAKALSPARVREVLVDDDGRQATVIVPDDQLSLAIGKEGLNARLAARLTGWRVDIRSETEFAEDEAEMGYEEEETATGRCAAILTNGRRCPNAALPGSRYCGLPRPPGAGRPGGRPPRGRRRRRRSPRSRPRPRWPSRAEAEEAAARARGRRARRLARRRVGDPAAGLRGNLVAPQSDAASPAGARPSSASCCASCASPTARSVPDPEHTRARPRRLPVRPRGVRRARAGRPGGLCKVLPRPGDDRPGVHTIGQSMAKKRVHEIAKERGMPSKEVIAKLQAAGFDVKAAASSVDEADVKRAFDGARPPSEAASRQRRRRRRASPRPTAAAGDGQKAPGAGRPEPPGPARPAAAAAASRPPAPAGAAAAWSSTPRLPAGVPARRRPSSPSAAAAAAAAARRGWSPTSTRRPRSPRSSRRRRSSPARPSRRSPSRSASPPPR